ncbi:MAG TPA: hypothetical protein VFN67_30325 [Polyangiales bacterium]|nr:hypothetical protein [Polyangiales bacterium]
MGYRNNALIVGGLALSLSVFTTSVHAQNNPEVGDVRYQGGVQPAPVATTTTVTTTNNGPFAQTVATTGTDHASVVGHLGVGHFGVIDLPYASSTMADGSARLSAPTIGARYWLDERLAIEGALGIGFESGSVTQKTGNMSVETSSPSVFGMALHAALPLVFATSQHFAFEVIPELNFGFVTGGQDLPMDELKLSGVLLQLGARVGAEIHFGFIDIPQLALQATVGLHLSYEGRSAEVGNVSTSTGALRFGTTLQNTPWDIFKGGVSAIYYF